MLRRMLVLTGLLTAGCSDSGMLPVGGVVQLDGKPIAGAAVMFHHASGRTAYAITDHDGRFRLTTRDPNDGALPGDHVVTIALAVQEGGVQADANGLEDYSQPATPVKSTALVPTVYNNPRTSPLRITIQKPVAPIQFDLSSGLGARSEAARR